MMTDEDDQLGLFPGGSRIDQSPRSPLSATQRMILAHARDHGSITPARAGRILHEARRSCGSGAKGGRLEGREACCVYASSDGVEALKRLVTRGALAHPSRGVYEPRQVNDWPARARTGDPATSHEAAASITPMELTESRRAILNALRTYGALPDHVLVERYQAATWDDWPQQSPSGIRSRRAELVEMGLVEAQGESTTPSGRRCIVWAANQ